MNRHIKAAPSINHLSVYNKHAYAKAKLNMDLDTQIQHIVSYYDVVDKKTYYNNNK